MSKHRELSQRFVLRLNVDSDLEREEIISIRKGWEDHPTP